MAVEEHDVLSDEITIETAAEVEVPITWEDGDDGTTTATFQADLLPPPIGRVGRFDILGRIAQGGMAEIFLAQEAGDGEASRLLVVKFIKSSMGGDEQLEQMFAQEAKVAMRLAHPNICHVYEVGESNRRHFIAMQWVNGVTLRDVVKTAYQAKTPVPLAVTAKIIAHVCEALDFAHRARDGSGKSLGVVHRDVSPHNIMVSYDGVTKLLDFGVAKIQESMTQSGTVKGKFAYMSPEQAQCNPVDGRSDIFSLGIVLYEALTSRRAYAGSSEYDSLRAIIEGPVPSPRKVDPTIPEELDAIVTKALAKNPRDRFQNAEAMQVELERWLAKNGEVVNAARISRVMRGLYGNQARKNPKLDRSREVSGSFSKISQSRLVRSSGSSTRLGLVGLLLLGLGVVAGAAYSMGVFGGDPATLEEPLAAETEAEATPPPAEMEPATEAEPPPEPEAPLPDPIVQDVQEAEEELASAEAEETEALVAAPTRMATRRTMRRGARPADVQEEPVEPAMRRGRFVTTPF